MQLLGKTCITGHQTHCGSGAITQALGTRKRKVEERLARERTVTTQDAIKVCMAALKGILCFIRATTHSTNCCNTVLP